MRLGARYRYRLFGLLGIWMEHLPVGNGHDGPKMLTEGDGK